ncbi:HAAS signaling domain-containing protein [Fictibacillus sp. S7]|uniref:HAAS signaling domain-containing protein n=1 Tax=Fictibacillus sp. S7 TaxID=2212476 RepID=UPI001012432D|nr:hypothetical protein [Fictibacillus sp. S7]RXY99936.1 hypothetical protein DMO16_09730 [Fictibacillus sp. S7]
MNLIELYIQEVTRRLPEKSRKDIGLELQSTIEDMLPEDFTEEDVKEVLKKLGNPAVLASGYRDRPQYLIGPEIYDIYISLLKMVLPIAITISVMALVAEKVMGYSGNESVMQVILSVIGKGIWNAISTGMQVFFWITLVFAILERTGTGIAQYSMTTWRKEWKPEDLKDIPYVPKKKAITRWEVSGSVIWTAIWGSLYYYASNLVGVYRSGDNGLELTTPVFNEHVLHSYWPLVVIAILLELLLAISKFRIGKWTMRLAFFNLSTQFIAFVILIIIFTNNQIFATAFMDLLSIVSAGQKELIGAVIIIFGISAAIDVFSGFRKARI